VQVFAYVCADTVEEHIAATIAHKRCLFSLLVGGIEIDTPARRDRADLFAAVGV
jgi:SNF2 family DNA or RNA helicase